MGSKRRWRRAYILTQLTTIKSPDVPLGDLPRARSISSTPLFPRCGKRAVVVVSKHLTHFSTSIVVQGASSSVMIACGCHWRIFPTACNLVPSSLSFASTPSVSHLEETVTTQPFLPTTFVFPSFMDSTSLLHIRNPAKFQVSFLTAPIGKPTAPSQNTPLGLPSETSACPRTLSTQYQGIRGQIIEGERSRPCPSANLLKRTIP